MNGGMNGVGSVPFVVGQWVRGSRFYGRAAQIAEILDGPRNWIWVVGTRRLLLPPASSRVL